jgi:hypothetical protein
VKKKTKKEVLTLSRETIRELEIQRVKQIVGASGGSCQTCISGITCCP